MDKQEAQPCNSLHTGIPNKKMSKRDLYKAISARSCVPGKEMFY